MSAGGAVADLQALLAENPVVVFTKPGCVYCQQAAELLGALGVAPLQSEDAALKQAVFEEIGGEERTG